MRFCTVGVCNTLINYVIFVGLLMQWKMNYLIAGAIGFFAGACFGFFVNRAWTFKQAVSHTQLAIYLSINGMSLLVNMGMQWLAVNWLSIPEVWSQFFGIAVTTLMNYTLSKRFIFHGKNVCAK